MWTVWVVSFSKIVFKAFPFVVGTLFFLPCCLLCISLFPFRFNGMKSHPVKGDFFVFYQAAKKLFHFFAKRSDILLTKPKKGGILYKV